MDIRNEFWQRPVSDRLALELVPGNRPRLSIEYQGQTVLELDLLEARALIEVLNQAVGELFILKRDPTAMAEVQRLLAQDVTLSNGDSERRCATAAAKISGHVQAQELVRRYVRGERCFARADLRFADLQGADLRQINLMGADLTGANLRRANLFQANLQEANLSQANLEAVGLYQANLAGADLSKANLRRAYLGKANLIGAQVTEEQLALTRVFKGATMPDGSTPE